MTGMERAKKASEWSQDPDTQVGVYIERGGYILGKGANRLATGIPVPDQVKRPDKYHWVMHAELDAIATAACSGTSLELATMYCTWFPCPMCASAIVKSGIRRLVCNPAFREDDPKWRFDLSRKILEAGKVEVVHE